MDWLPIAAARFWRKITVWEEIRHTCSSLPQLPNR